ncbi:MAG: class I tRNA ligase family protein, partial [Bowdeniella nasicola]|nr:class I tRNA ligase family protein [Bowdeniella nasicola]
PGSDTYAPIASDPQFGTVSQWSETEMAAVFADRGGDPDRPGKTNPFDPLLWRAERAGEPSWDGGTSGQGRPGWHIECAAIAEHYLGGSPDICGGGADLIFPHHEMSAMHLRALGHETPALHLHTGMIGYEGEKMSKSLGNLVLVSQLIADGIDPRVVRLALLDHHWSASDLERAEHRLEAYRHAVAVDRPGSQLTALVVHDCLCDDLDTPAALWALDAWAAGNAPRLSGEDDREDLTATVDALLGIDLSV